MIKGLERRLNEAGKIKIGMKGEEVTTTNGKKMRLPVRLDHFVITTTEKGPDGDFVLDVDLMDDIKDSSSTLTDGKNNIVGIPIRLLYDDTELNFPTRLACYANGILECEGNGEKSRKRMDNFEREYSCPCAKYDDPAYTGFDKCKANGKLTCVIDAAGLFGQVHIFRTTSYNSITGIIGGIELIKTATSGKIAGLPLMLIVNNKTTVTPTGAATTIQVVSICYRGSMAELQQKCLSMVTENAQFLIGMKTLEDDARKMGVTKVVPDEDDHDFQAEFYPQTAENSVDADVLDVVIDESETIPSNTANGQTFVNSRDLLNDEQKKEAAQSQEKTKKTVEQLGLFYRLRNEPGKTEAGKLVRRLDKEMLVKFLIEAGTPDDMPAEGSKKPEYLEACDRIINSDDWENIVSAHKARIGFSHISIEQTKPEQTQEPVKEAVQQAVGIEVYETPAEEKKVRDPLWVINPFLIELSKIDKQPETVALIRKRFVDTVINGTLPIHELHVLAEKLLKADIEEKAAAKAEKAAEVTTKPQPEKKEDPKEGERNPYAWDNGPAILESQLKQIAGLKGMMGIKDPIEWSKLVGRYLDASGNPLPLAAKMTLDQADHFIKDLDKVPF